MAGPEVALAAQVVGTVVSTMGALQQGKAADAAAKSQAMQLEARAKQQEAVAQQKAIEERRQADIVSSRARSLIAAGGGDTTDVGSQDVLSGIAGEGEYRSLLQLYEGKEAANASIFEANVKRAEGKAAKKSSKFAAASNLFSGSSSIYDKYSTMTPKTDVWGNPYGTPWKNPDL